MVHTQECFSGLLTAEDPVDVLELRSLDPLPWRKHHDSCDSRASERIFRCIGECVHVVEGIMDCKSNGNWEKGRKGKAIAEDPDPHVDYKDAAEPPLPYGAWVHDAIPGEAISVPCDLSPV